MHHGAYAYRSEALDFGSVVAGHIGAQIGIAVLQTVPYVVDAVGPQSVNEAVFPLMAPLGYRFALRVGKYGLYAGGAEFDAEYGFPAFNDGFCVSFHIH